jgi:hypothetical protein
LVFIKSLIAKQTIGDSRTGLSLLQLLEQIVKIKKIGGGLFLNRKILVLFFAVSLLWGCQSGGETMNFLYRDILPYKEGTYSIVLIYPDNINEYTVPDFMKGYQQGTKVSKVVQMPLESFQEEYPRLTVTQSPFYLFLNTEGIVFQTNKEDEAVNFYKEKVNIR